MFVYRAKRTNTDTVSLTSSKNEVVLRIYESALIFQPLLIAAKTKTLQLQPDEKSIISSVISGYHDDNTVGVHPHPCHKPFEALEPLIRQWTKPNDLILDIFAGSGGILLSAVKLNRRIKGIEKISEWVKFANNEISNTLINNKT